MTDDADRGVEPRIVAVPRQNLERLVFVRETGDALEGAYERCRGGCLGDLRLANRPRKAIKERLRGTEETLTAIIIHAILSRAPPNTRTRYMADQSTRGMTYLRSPKVKSVEQIWSAILRYCELNARVNWAQDSYKSDFFAIFADAFYSGHCGWAANRRLAQARKRRKRKKTPVEEFVVSPVTIKAWLRKNWAKPRTEMIDDLLVWWEEWTYAWSHHPGHLSRPYVRRKKYDPDEALRAFQQDSQ